MFERLVTSENHYGMGELHNFVHKQDRPFVLMFYHAFKHLRRSVSVDKIKKYHRDSPSGVFTDLGLRDSSQPRASANPDGRCRQ